MKLDINTNPDGRGKYALLKLRDQPKGIHPECLLAAKTLFSEGLLDYGDKPDTEFFVIRLKDKHAAPALAAYAASAFRDDREYGMEVLDLALRAAEYPNPKHPD